jgi:HTH-type transcriptional regulator, glycine betaine synthesis regulator
MPDNSGKGNASEEDRHSGVGLHFMLNLIFGFAINQRVTTGFAQNNMTEVPGKTAPSQAWTCLEAEVIGLFVQLSRIIGLPRSYAEIYGMLFMSPQPLTMDELIERLGISRGSACQGLIFLRKAGTIRKVLIPGRRPAHYNAVAELRRLALGLLQDQILPQVEDSQNRLKQIVGMVARLPAKERAQASSKITMLQSWGKQTAQFLPIVVKMMEA